MAHGELAALIDLLQDDNRKVLSAVGDRLIDLDDAAVDALREAMHHPTAKVRTRARDILTRIERRGAFRRLIDYAGRADVDLEEGAMLLACVHSPTLDVARLRSRIDEMALEISTDVIGLDGEEKLSQFLAGVHDALGFGGDVEDFFSYDNNFLNTVIERRRGLPISIIMIYILLGRRLGMDFRAVGAPHRALAWYSADGFETYINAFDGGDLWSFDDCVAFLKRQGFFGIDYEQYLRRLTDRQILERMAQNLMNYCDARSRIDDRENFRIFANALYHARNRDTVAADAREASSE